MVFIVHTLIKNVPKNIQDQIEREEYITQKVIWENKTSKIYTSSLTKLTEKSVLENKKDV